VDFVVGSVQFPHQGFEQFDVEGARPPVCQAEGENTFVLRTFDHRHRFRTVQEAAVPPAELVIMLTAGRRSNRAGNWLVGAEKRNYSAIVCRTRGFVNNTS
jgi:hypothetical protein